MSAIDQEDNNILTDRVLIPLWVSLVRNKHCLPPPAYHIFSPLFGFSATDEVKDRNLHICHAKFVWLGEFREHLNMPKSCGKNGQLRL